MNSQGADPLFTSARPRRRRHRPARVRIGGVFVLTRRTYAPDRAGAALRGGLPVPRPQRPGLRRHDAGPDGAPPSAISTRDRCTPLRVSHACRRCCTSTLYGARFCFSWALKRAAVRATPRSLVFVACALACFAIPLIGTQPTAWAQTNYAGPFVDLSLALLLTSTGSTGAISPESDTQTKRPVHDAPAVAAARFVAFAYTYHYLNSFSRPRSSAGTTCRAPG